MTRIALKGLLGRKMRAALTALAIVLGVAMVSGSFVLTDTITKAFDHIFSSSYGNTDAVVSGKKLVDFSSSGNATVSRALLEKIRAQRDVAAAAGTVLDFGGDSTRAKIIGRDGKAIDHNGAGTFGIGIDTSQPRFNPLQLTGGRWATASNEVVIDPETATSEHFELGQMVGIAANGPVRKYKLVGVAKYGDVKSLGGATFAVFTIPAAENLLAPSTVTTAISVTGQGRRCRSRSSSRELQQPSFRPPRQVRTAAAQAKQDEQGDLQAISASSAARCSASAGSRCSSERSSSSTRCRSRSRSGRVSSQRCARSVRVVVRFCGSVTARVVRAGRARVMVGFVPRTSGSPRG